MFCDYLRVDVLWLWPLIFVLFWFQCGTSGCFVIMTTDFCTILFSVRYEWMFRDYDHWFLYYSVFRRYGWMFCDYDHWFLYYSGFSAVRVDVLWLWPLILVLFWFQCGTGGCFVIMTTDFCTILFSDGTGGCFVIMTTDFCTILVSVQYG